MYSMWNSPWVLLCLFSSVAAASPKEPDIKINIAKKEETIQDGSCVTIDCEYNVKNILQLLWIKDPKWNDKEKRFDGIIVYSNTEDRPQDPEYSGRVEYNGKNNNGRDSCTLKLNHLKKNDSGNYTFRYIAKYDRFIGTVFNLTVTDNPCKVHIRPNVSSSLKEGDSVSLYCATSAACKRHPVWLLSGSSEVLRIENKENEEKLGELNLTVNWTDDGKTFTCHPSGSQDNCLDRSITLTVEYSPKDTKIIESSSTKDVKEGDQLKMSCSSKARPTADFKWFKNEVSLPQHGETLTINSMTAEYSGIFYCQAENKHGSEKSHGININVTYAPKGVSISPQAIELKEGELLTLKCQVEKSNPAVKMHSYIWYKDEQVISQQETDTFTMHSVTWHDKGQYQCQARNSVGGTRSTNRCQVSVKYVPQNTNIQGSNKIKLDSKLNLICVTDAHPLPHNYCWYFKPEHGKQFHSLSRMDQGYWIERVAVRDAGWYMCSAQNDIGSGENSTEFNVLVVYPPKTPNLTMKEVVKENEWYTIICTVESSPQSNLTLHRPSLTNLKKNSSNFLNFTTKASLSDAGVYTCTAENSEGVNSTQNQLKVWYAPKNVKASAHPGEELKEGSNLELVCNTESVPPASNYTWIKSFGTDTVTVGQGQNITLHSLNSSDSGNYFCISSNEMGRVKSPQIYIRVKYRPRIKIIHNMTSLGLWETVPVHLSCSVQCDPPATYFAWYKLEENTTVLSHHQNFTFQPQNPGTYYCTAHNEVGNSRSEPVKINLNRFIIERLIQVIISLLVIIFLIGLMFLLRIFLKKRSSGTNAAQRSFYISDAPLWSLSNLLSLRSQNNTRENLVMEGSTELSGLRENDSATAVHSNLPANRNRQTGRPNSNIHTVYDAVKLPPSIPKPHHHREEDFTTLNYAMLQFTDSKNPNKSVPSHEGRGPIYAEVSKNKQMAKGRQVGHEDYENVSGANVIKQPFPNINWDSDSTESEEEEEALNYTKVSFTVTSHHKPRKDVFVSDEEDKTEYSEVKI